MTLYFKGLNHIGWKVYGKKPTVPKVGKLRCDRISMTVDIPGTEREKLKTTFKKLLKNQYCIPINKKNQYYHSYKIPLQDVSFGVHGQESVLVQFDPHVGSYNYLRCEYNPDKASPGKVKLLLDKILPDGYNRIMNGKITRFDETVLIHFCEIDDLMFYYPNLQATTTYKSSGKIETEYLGSIKAKGSGNGSSEKVFCIYDKTKEIKVKNTKSHPYLEKKEPIPDYPITRVEYRFKPKSKSFTLKDLKLMESPLKKLIISEYYNLDIINDFKNKDERSHFKLFLDSCRYRGIQQSYKLLTESKRKKFRKIVKGASAKWWDGDKINDQRVSLIDRILNPKPAKLDFYFPTFALNCNA
ncbi:MAG: replication initiation factor domain-containing protein [Desulfobacteraceae bacterium]|nr:replication initiation factor domain-containing protein [Desulfobacteraceae bacterium]